MLFCLIALIILLASNPIGWAVVGVLAFPSLADMFADWAYQTNKLGLQDKTGWVGHKIDDGIDVVKESAEVIIDSVENTVDEATKSIGKHINPMKWVW